MAYDDQDPRVANILSTLKIYKQLASSTASKRTGSLLKKDSACVSFLVYVLDDESVSVIRAAAEILDLLTDTREHCTTLKTICPNLAPALTKTLDKKDLAQDVRFLLESLLCRLTTREAVPLQQLQNSIDKLNVSSASESSKSADVSGSSKASSFAARPSQQQTTRKGFKFIAAGSAKRAKTLTFQVTAISQDTKCTIEAQLLRIKGVVSIYFDSHKLRFVVRARLEVKPDIIASVIAKTDAGPVSQVVMDEYGDEHLVTLSETAEDDDKENQENMPDYLNESFGNSPQGDADEKMIVRPNERKRKNRRESGGWLGGIASFVTSSFYW